MQGKRLLFLRLTIVSVLLALICIAGSLCWAMFHSNRLVLVQLFKNTDCACGDYQEELSGFIILNPFRDRSPEQTADHFFRALQSGNCPPQYSSSVCSYYREGHEVDGWTLRNAHTGNNSATLFYRLRRTGEKSGPARVLLSSGGSPRSGGLQATIRTSDSRCCEKRKGQTGANNRSANF